MPIHFFASTVSAAVPTEYWASIAAACVAVSFLKTWSKGAKLLDPPTSSVDAAQPAALHASPFKDLHGRVVLVASGGFTPAGVVTLSALAHRGAQIIALTPDIAAQDILQLVHLLRDSTQNELIFAEQCDTADLSSINQFVKRWNEGDKKQPEGVRRLDTLLFLPPAVMPYSSTSRVYESHILGKFHMINAMLSSLLLMPPDREIRIVSYISPYYAAGLSQFDAFGHNGKPNSSQPSYSALVGAASLRWYALSVELQRRLNLLAEADPRPRTKLPGIDPMQATTAPMPSSKTLLQHQHARTSNIVLINICPGFERNADILDIFLPRPIPPSPPASPANSHALAETTTRKNKTAKITILEQNISERTQFTPSLPVAAWYYTKLSLWLILTLMVWPFVWLLSKSPATASNSFVWATIKKLETQSQFLDRLQREHTPSGVTSKDVLADPVVRWDDPLLPTEVYREGRIVRPQLPARFTTPAASAASKPRTSAEESEFSKLWTHEETVVEQRIKALGGHIVRPKT